MLSDTSDYEWFSASTKPPENVEIILEVEILSKIGNYSEITEIEVIYKNGEWYSYNHGETIRLNPKLPSISAHRHPRRWRHKK